MCREGMTVSQPRLCGRLSSVLFGLCCLVLLGGCTVLHHAQVGEVDSEIVMRGQRFEVLVSALGVDVDRAADLAKAFARTEEAESNIDGVRDIVNSFQMGPKTGNVVFDDTFADGVFEKIRASCPSGRVSGLVAIRETADYDLVSGEFVKITGYCQK